MDREELVRKWLREERQPFTGWDFSYLDGRLIEGREHWSYFDRASAPMQCSVSMLDMDTGGGEKLLSLQEHWSERVVATEDYLPNVNLATERLSSLGVQVVNVSVSDIEPMPFADGEFNLILNRHAPFNSSEVARVLSVGGTFLTQQVHRMWAWDLVASFDAAPQFPDARLGKNVPRLEVAGLTIQTVEEWEGYLVFTDVGAIVYYLKAIPWMVPGFTVETHLRNFLALQEMLEAGGELVFHAAKYLIEARKPLGSAGHSSFFVDRL